MRCGTRTGPAARGELLPHDLPPTGAVRYYLDVWKRDGLDERINDDLRTLINLGLIRTDGAWTLLAPA